MGPQLGALEVSGHLAWVGAPSSRRRRLVITRGQMRQGHGAGGVGGRLQLGGQGRYLGVRFHLAIRAEPDIRALEKTNPDPSWHVLRPCGGMSVPDGERPRLEWGRELLPQPALTPALSSEPLGPHAGLWHLPCGPESVRLSGPQAPSSASQSRVKVGWTLAARRPCPAPCPGQSCGVRSLTAAPSGRLPRRIPPFTALSFLQRCPPPLCLPPCPSVPRTRVLLPPLAPDLCAQEALPCCPRGPAAWRGD